MGCAKGTGEGGAALSRSHSRQRVWSSGIRCNCVAPGLVWTRFMEKYEEQFRPEIECTPLRRFGTPDDVADVIAFLVALAIYANFIDIALRPRGLRPVGLRGRGTNERHQQAHGQRRGCAASHRCGRGRGEAHGYCGEHRCGR
ncbi:MAG: SDR family oxidoreductase [Actinobacteria bacterium]|nr:MAG: SDR family oxidoreductase [Actinomycetota bacterium]